MKTPFSNHPLAGRDFLWDALGYDTRRFSRGES